MSTSNPFEQPEWPLEPCASDTHTDSYARLWTYCLISYGARGGRWAYCRVIGKPWLGVVVDTRQNLQSASFAGMLATPWDGLSKAGWVLDRDHCQPVAEKLEPEPADSVRFERLEKPPLEEL